VAITPYATSYLDGAMGISGSLTENVTNLTTDPSKSEFVVRSGAQVLAILDEDGNLRLRGRRYDRHHTHLD